MPAAGNAKSKNINNLSILTVSLIPFTNVIHMLSDRILVATLVVLGCLSAGRGGALAWVAYRQGRPRAGGLTSPKEQSLRCCKPSCEAPPHAGHPPWTRLGHETPRGIYAGLETFIPYKDIKCQVVEKLRQLPTYPPVLIQVFKLHMQCRVVSSYQVSCPCLLVTGNPTGNSPTATGNDQ